MNIEEAPKVKRRLRDKTTDKDNLFAVLGEEAPKERRRLTKKTKDDNNIFKKPKEKTRLTKKQQILIIYTHHLKKKKNM